MIKKTEPYLKGYLHFYVLKCFFFLSSTTEHKGNIYVENYVMVKKRH